MRIFKIAFFLDKFDLFILPVIFFAGGFFLCRLPNLHGLLIQRQLHPFNAGVQGWNEKSFYYCTSKF